MGRVGPGGAANSGRGLPLLARPQPPLSGPDFRNLRVVVGGTPCAIARADRRGAPDLSKRARNRASRQAEQGSLVSVRAELGSVLPRVEGEKRPVGVDSMGPGPDRT